MSTLDSTPTALDPDRTAPHELRAAPREPVGFNLWMIDHDGSTVLKCRCLDVSEDGMRLRVPLGYGVAEGQRYELRSHRPGEPAGLGFGVVGSRWATVVHTRILVGQDEHHLDVGVVLDEAHSSLTWTPGGAGFAAEKTPS